MVKIGKFIVFGIVLLLFYWVFRSIGLEAGSFLNNVIRNVLRINIFFLVLSVLISLGSYFLMCYRWKIILDRIFVMKYAKLLPFMFIGQFISSITPGVKLGGEPARSYFLSKETKISQAKLLATIILDKFFNVLSFIAILLFAMAYVVFFVSMPRVFMLIFEIAFLVILFLVAFFLVFRKSFKLFYFEWILVLLFKIWFVKSKFDGDYEKFKEYVVSKARVFYKIFNESFDDKKVLFRALLLSFVVWFFCFLSTYFLFLSFNYSINIWYLIVAVTIATFFGDISFSPGGLAVTESVAIIMYFFLGINLIVAAGVVLLDRFIYYLISVGIGGPIFTYFHFKK